MTIPAMILPPVLVPATTDPAAQPAPDEAQATAFLGVLQQLLAPVRAESPLPAALPSLPGEPAASEGEEAVEAENAPLAEFSESDEEVALADSEFWRLPRVAIGTSGERPSSAPSAIAIVDKGWMNDAGGRPEPSRGRAHEQSMRPALPLAATDQHADRAFAPAPSKSFPMTPVPIGSEATSEASTPGVSFEPIGSLPPGDSVDPAPRAPVREGRGAVDVSPVEPAPAAMVDLLPDALMTAVAGSNVRPVPVPRGPAQPSRSAIDAQETSAPVKLVEGREPPVARGIATGKPESDARQGSDLPRRHEPEAAPAAAEPSPIVFRSIGTAHEAAPARIAVDVPEGSPAVAADLPAREAPAAPPATRVTLELDGNGDDPTRIQVSVQGGVVRATVIAGSDEAARLNRHTDELKRSLEAQGFSEAGVLVRGRAEPAMTPAREPSRNGAETESHDQPRERSESEAREQARRDADSRSRQRHARAQDDA